MTSPDQLRAFSTADLLTELARRKAAKGKAAKPKFATKAAWAKAQVVELQGKRSQAEANGDAAGIRALDEEIHKFQSIASAFERRGI